MALSDLYIQLRKILIEISQTYREANSEPELPNLTIKQYYYLDNIYRINNPTYSEIAEKLKVTKPAVTSIVNKLIKIGYLERVQSATDRRVYYIMVNNRGKKLIEINDGATDAYAKYVEECLTEDELKTHIDILRKVIVNYEFKNNK
ncbi:MarR family winged helix-turn-helix transcriptional regulator [Propionispora vibrioides]|uniref:DNA-binding transcriptional regulator, MarR family n=1 Tax=Propionispora vibrioides TaxID=112903 RepID=A0A1H8XMA3_9FIRM|nr:MarR family transcriptional regulator [Propionispora vibrioides]SEP41059.1 DNA-binding transcriptional regulator, MarR family [Propionispora vibrioides]